MLELEPHDVDVDGLVFREVLSVTQIDTAGNAHNVIPARVEATLNFRYAPDRTMAEAEARLRELVGRDVEIVQQLAGRARRARARRSSSGSASVGGFAVSRSRRGRTSPTSPRAASTRSTSGPGATRYAHAADEQVEIAELARTYEALQRFLLGSV